MKAEHSKTADPWGHNDIPRKAVEAGIEVLSAEFGDKIAITMDDGEFIVCEIYKRMTKAVASGK